MSKQFPSMQMIRPTVPLPGILSLRDRESTVIVESWWLVVQAMADYVACGFSYEELEEEWVKQALVAQGFAVEDVDSALAWLEMAALSGNVSDVFSMLQPVALSTRIASPLEKICIADKIWEELAEMRARGLISDDFAERLLEGVRSVDTRDWEDEDVHYFLQEVLSTSFPMASPSAIKRLSKKKSGFYEFYS